MLGLFLLICLGLITVGLMFYLGLCWVDIVVFSIGVFVNSVVAYLCFVYVGDDLVSFGCDNFGICL